MKIREIIQDYFTYNKRERKGILALILIIVGLILALNLMKYFQSETKIDFSEFKSEISHFETLQKEFHKESKSKYESNYKDKNKKQQTNSTLFPFNPNNLPIEQWKKLGMKDWQIKIIHNYESKGGKFRKKNDLKRIYGISDDTYNLFEPYILLPEKLPDNSNDWKEDRYRSYEEGKMEYKETELAIQLNSADTTELKKIRGIGSVYSKRIIKYRDLLGGFYYIEQLNEVYGLKPELVESISKYFVVDVSTIRKINVNTAKADELRKHPYIKWNVANSIVNYREKHGQYQSLEDIMKSNLVNDELYAKIAPYLKL